VIELTDTELEILNSLIMLELAGRYEHGLDVEAELDSLAEKVSSACNNRGLS
jgi:hypothetical protein